MKISELLARLGPPRYRECECASNSTTQWYRDERAIPTPEVRVVRRDESMIEQYVLYTYSIDNDEYIEIGLGGDDDGGCSGYWPVSEFHAAMEHDAMEHERGY